MKMRTLGSTGLQVSELCLGTMQFGWTADEASSFEVLDTFLDAGGNFVDTADIYSRWSAGNSGGEAEEILGRWLKARGNRGRLVIATKVRGEMWSGEDGEGLSRAHITRAVEGSLRRLQVDDIDLYQCHWPDVNVPFEETLAVFADLIAAGKVRYVGVSNYDAAQLEEALGAADADQRERFVSLQPHYNLVHRSEFEGELEDVCRREGLAVIPYSPLAGGFLTGKYKPGRPPPDSQRAGNVRKYADERGYKVLEAVEDVARARNATVPAVALAWLLAHPLVTAPIIGANTTGQLADLLPATELALPAQEKRALDDASFGL